MKYDIFQTDRENAEVLPNGLRYLVKRFDKRSPNLMIWSPRAKKPSVNYIIQESQIEETIKTYSDRFDNWNFQKIEYKKKNAVTSEKLESVNVGDIFKCSWGWEQTNVDFYIILNRKGKKITVSQIGCLISSQDSWGSGKKIPCPDSLIGDPKTYTLTFWDTQPQFKISSFETASKWEGKPCYFSDWA